MASVVLVDTGPLVALFDPSDRHRETCRRELEALRRFRRVTTTAVLTEAAYLLDFALRAQTTLLSFVAAGGVEVIDLTTAELPRAAALMAKYQNLPMDFADASLVVLAERLSTRSIFTLDHRDFSTYRIGRESFRLIPRQL